MANLEVINSIIRGKIEDDADDRPLDSIIDEIYDLVEYAQPKALLTDLRIDVNGYNGNYICKYKLSGIPYKFIM